MQLSFPIGFVFEIISIKKNILVDKPGEEHLYMEAVIVDYGKFLSTP